MNEKEAAAFLKDLKNTAARNDAKVFEINRIMKNRDFIESLKLDEITAAAGDREDLLAAVAALRAASERYGAILEKLSESISGNLQKRDRAEEILCSLPPVYEKILRARYLRGKSWVAVSMELNYSERQTYYLRKKALAEFAKKWDAQNC